MKKAVALVLVLTLALSLAACGLTRKSETVPEEDNQSAVVQDNQPADNTNPENNAAEPGVAQQDPQPAVVTPAVVVTAFPAPSNTPAPTPTVPPTPETTANPAASSAPTIKTKTTATQEELNNAKEGYVSGDGVNMRDGIGTSAEVITSYPVGTKLQILGTENGWTKVSVNGTVGYIYSKYVATGAYPGGGTGNVYVSNDVTPVGDGNATIIESNGTITYPAATTNPGSTNSSGETNAVIILD